MLGRPKVGLLFLGDSGLIGRLSDMRSSTVSWRSVGDACSRRCYETGGNPLPAQCSKRTPSSPLSRDTMHPRLSTSMRMHITGSPPFAASPSRSTKEVSVFTTLFIVSGVIGVLVVAMFYVNRREASVDDGPYVYFRCPFCNKKLRFQARKAGRPGMCPCCRRRWTMPASTALASR